MRTPGVSLRASSTAMDFGTEERTDGVTMEIAPGLFLSKIGNLLAVIVTSSSLMVFKVSEKTLCP